MKQTAVEWLINWGKQNPIAFQSDYYAAIEKAKEMEKEQIIDAFDTGTTDKDRVGEEYYNDIYSHPDPSDDEIFNNFNHEGGIKYETNS
jgi:hypothetical protein